MRQGMGAKMWLLCLLLAVEMALVQPDKIPNFALFVPRDVYYPSTDTFCLHSSRDLQGYSQISVDLKTSSGSVNLYTVHPDSPTWHCQSFQVPEPSEDTEKVTIAVHGHDIGGNKTEFSSKELTMRKKSTGTLIQTDRALYKPGQKIMIRIVTLDQDLEVLNKTYPLVELQDPQNNRLAQWKDVYAKSRIVELSYEMSPEAATGKYRIRTNEADLEFTVDEYILTKFEVNVEGPSSISILDEEVTLWVSGMYTYGENVQGNVSLTVCQKKNRMYWWRTKEKKDDEKDNICYSYSTKTESCGKLKSVVNLSQFRLRDSDYERQLKVEATLEEEGTDVKFSAPNKIISIQSLLTKLSFKDTRKYYQPGAPYRGKLVLESFDGKRLSGKKVHLSVEVKGESEKQIYVTDSFGEVSFQLSTSTWGKNSVSLVANIDEKNEPYSPNTVSIRYGSANLYLQDIYVVTNSSVYIHPVKSSARCHENVTVTVDYTIEEEEEDNIDFFYLVLVNNRVSLGGQKKVKKADSLSSSFQFTLPIVDISPSGKLLVFMMSHSSGIAADITEVEVTACLKHKVSLRFSEGEVLPGSPVQLHLQANGGSVCALRAVDKSVVLMKPEAELTESKIQNLVPQKRSYIYSNRYDYKYCENKEPDVIIKSTESDTVNSYDWWDDYPEKKKDFLDIFQDMGFYVVSSWNIVAPTICIRRRIMPIADVAPGIPMAGTMSAGLGSRIMLTAGKMALSRPASGQAPNSMRSADAPTSSNDGGSSSEPRTFFPETWLFELKEVSAYGSAEISLSAPDTITEWNTQMFCAGPGGLGLSSPVSLKVFQTFFVDLLLPYSVKRGESFLLKASIFNFLSDPMEISTSLPSSDQFQIKESSINEFSLCLPGGMKRTVSWDVTPTVLGQMNITVIAEAIKGRTLCGKQETVIPKKGNRDVVIQSVLVVPEGTVVEQTHNSLLICDGNSVSEKVKFELPSSYVPGSQKAFISVCGDIMGPSMSNIGNLLAMSHGCGEQNMILFAPNVYILKYLKSSDQLNPTVLAKGKDMLEKGRTRQLMYKRSDGSYSAFGKDDQEGSTWLTAFVMKSFGQAKELTNIDEEVVKDGMSWLNAQQKSNGCFKATGRVLHNGMKGGVDDEISLSSYVAAALLEIGIESSNPIVEQALKCIEIETLDNASLYKLALKAYAFTLAGHEENRAAVLEKLDQQATKADGLKYWTQETKSYSESYWSKPKSVDVEMTAYVLLSLATRKNPIKKELEDMAAIVRWLSKQQNANGGFSSTQDTVVALQAMAKFASHTSSPAGVLTVDVTSENGFHRSFQVDSGNRLLLQKEQLPELPGEYTVTVSGNGTLVMQAVQRHNILPDTKDDAFVLSANPLCMKSDLLQISLEFWYTGERQSTNMAIAKIQMLSGFVPQKESMDQLKNNPLVKRVESEEDAVSIYIEKVTSELQTLELQVEQTVPVADRKPAIIKIFDYYMPEEETTISYLMNC